MDLIRPFVYECGDSSCLCKSGKPGWLLMLTSMHSKQVWNEDRGFPAKIHLVSAVVPGHGQEQTQE